jgi:hypothetical protein
MDQDPRLRAFPPGKKWFWMQCVREIHALGDDDGLAFGQDGDSFETHAEFAEAVGGSPDDLEYFLRRGLLTRLDDGGIDLPSRIGLKPRPQPYYDSAYEAANDAGEMPNYPDDDVGEIGNFPHVDVGEITPADEAETPISPSSAGFARTAAAAAYAKENQYLSNSSSTDSRAGDVGEIGNFPHVNAGEIPVINATSDAAEIHAAKIESQRSAAAADLTAELKAMVRPGATPTAKDLGAVLSWLDAGETPGTLRAVIQTRMANWTGQPPTSLRYFDQALNDAREARNHAPARPASGGRPPTAAPPAAPPEPEEDPAAFIGDDPPAQFARGRRRIMKRVGGREIKAYLGQMQLIGVADDEVTLGMPTQFLRDYVRQHYADGLLTAWREENPHIRLLNIEVLPPTTAPPVA